MKIENVVTMTTDGLDGRKVLAVIAILKSGKDRTQEVDMVVSNHGGVGPKKIEHGGLQELCMFALAKHA